jgi:hypothetical protein
MLESHSEPAPPQVAQPRQEITQLGANPVLAAGAIIKDQDLTTLYISPATNFPQAFQYCVDIYIDRISLSAARVSCGGIPYHYRNLSRW